MDQEETKSGSVGTRFLSTPLEFVLGRTCPIRQIRSWPGPAFPSKLPNSNCLKQIAAVGGNLDTLGWCILLVTLSILHPEQIVGTLPLSD